MFSMSSLLESRSDLLHLRTPHGLKANPANKFTNFNWMFYLSRTTSSRRCDPMVLGTVKLEHRNSTISFSTRERDAAKYLTARKNITKEFTIVFYETQQIVIRNSKLAGPSRSASKWISWHRRITPTVYPGLNSRDIKNSGIPHSTNRARMHRCDFDQTSELQSRS